MIRLTSRVVFTLIIVATGACGGDDGGGDDGGGDRPAASSGGATQVGTFVELLADASFELNGLNQEGTLDPTEVTPTALAVEIGSGVVTADIPSQDQDQFIGMGANGLSVGDLVKIRITEEGWVFVEVATEADLEAQRNAADAQGSDPAVTVTIEVGEHPQFVAATDDAVWVVIGGDETVMQLDPATNEVVATAEPEGNASGTVTLLGVAANDAGAWAVNQVTNAVVHIDAVTGEIADTIQVDDAPVSVAASDDAVWVVNGSGLFGTVSRIDPATDRLIAQIDVEEATAVAATDDAVWVTHEEDGTVSRLDPATDQVIATIEVDDAPHFIAATEDAVWVSHSEDGTVSRIDPATDEVTATIDLGEHAGAIVATDDMVWVVNAGEDEVSRIDPATDEITAAVNVGERPEGIAIGGSAVWVTNFDDGTVSRIG